MTLIHVHCRRLLAVSTTMVANLLANKLNMVLDSLAIILVIILGTRK
jgi:hypothetical protein